MIPDFLLGIAVVLFGAIVLPHFLNRRLSK